MKFISVLLLIIGSINLIQAKPLIRAEDLSTILTTEKQETKNKKIIVYNGLYTKEVWDESDAHCSYGPVCVISYECTFDIEPCQEVLPSVDLNLKLIETNH